jgi:hypothetical protein
MMESKLTKKKEELKEEIKEIEKSMLFMSTKEITKLFMDMNKSNLVANFKDIEKIAELKGIQFAEDACKDEYLEKAESFFNEFILGDVKDDELFKELWIKYFGGLQK